MKKIGIIGCGKIAQVRHIPELHANPNAQIVGYYNPTRSRAEEMATKYGGRVYDTVDALLADLGIHKTDLIQYLLGQNVVKVKAVLTTLDKTDMNGELISVDDNAICIYTMEDGAIGTMTVSWTYYGEEDNSTILYGTKGIMRIYDNPAFAIEIIGQDGKKEQLDVEPIQTNDNQTSSGMSDLFVEVLESGATQDFPISAASVLPAMRVIFAAIESDREGKEITITENYTKKI